MENKNVILIAIAVLVIALLCVGAYIITDGSNPVNITSNNTTNFVEVTDTVDVNNTTEVVGDNSTLDLNTTPQNNTTEYKVYNPQSDSYVPVIGEAFDDEVNRWYTYDADGVRYYNTRIN